MLRVVCGQDFMLYKHSNYYYYCLALSFCDERHSNHWAIHTPQVGMNGSETHINRQKWNPWWQELVMDLQLHVWFSQNISVKHHCLSLLSVCTVCVFVHLLHSYVWTLVDVNILCISFLLNCWYHFPSQCTLCALCLFSTLSHRVGTLQISIIIIYLFSFFSRATRFQWATFLVPWPCCVEGRSLVSPSQATTSACRAYPFLVCSFFYFFLDLPWYNCTGWLGVKHQVTILTQPFRTLLWTLYRRRMHPQLSLALNQEEVCATLV